MGRSDRLLVRVDDPNSHSPASLAEVVEALTRKDVIVPAHVIVQFAAEYEGARGKPEEGKTAAPPVTARVKRLVADHDGQLSLTPSEPGTSPPSMAMITVPDMDRANALANALRDLDGVETAYSKPGEELP